jgi:DNA repair exonuclease SbcCD ATPase subunit
LEEKIELPKEMKYDEEKIKELEEKLNKMSGENPKVKDIKELLLERNKLEEKIRVLKSKDDKKEVTQDISNKILLLKKDLEVLKTSKQEELDIKESEKTLISLRGEYLQKQKDVERIQKEIKALEEKKRKHRVGDVCFTCKQALTEEAVKKLQEEVQNDINKKLKELQDAEKEFKEVSSKGVELAKEVEKIKTKYKMELEKFEIEKEKKSSKINKDIMDLQKQLEEINKAQNASEVKKEISAIENKIKELNIEKIEEENKKTIKEFEDKIASEREAIMKELNVTRKLKEEVVKNNAKKEELTKLKKENAEKAVKEKQDIKEIDEEVKVLNKKIDQMRNFNSEMMKITNEILSRHLDKVEISLQKVLKTSGEIRDDFEVFYDGRALRKCSLSEAIKAGIELSYMISQLTGLEFPVIVDNSESITDIDSSKAFQIIKLRVEKDEPLSYKKDDGRFEAIYVKKEREKEIKPNIIEIVGA